MTIADTYASLAHPTWGSHELAFLGIALDGHDAKIRLDMQTHHYHLRFSDDSTYIHPRNECENICKAVAKETLAIINDYNLPKDKILAALTEALS